MSSDGGVDRDAPISGASQRTSEDDLLRASDELSSSDEEPNLFELEVDVDDMRYSKGALSPTFSTGPPVRQERSADIPGRQAPGLPLKDCVALLVRGRLTVDAFPRIRVNEVREWSTNHDGSCNSAFFVVEGNRRLYVFKNAGIRKVVVEVVAVMGRSDYPHKLKGTLGCTVKVITEGSPASKPLDVVMMDSQLLHTLDSANVTSQEVADVLPTTFPASMLAQYARSFQPLVVMEASASVRQGLQSINPKSLLWHVTAVQDMEATHADSPSGTIELKVQGLTPMSERRLRTGAAPDARDKPRVYDAVMLANFQPHNYDHLKRVEQAMATGDMSQVFALGVLRIAHRQEKKKIIVFHFRTRKEHPVWRALNERQEKRQTWWLLKVENLTTAMRTCHAITCLRASSSPICPIFEEILQGMDNPRTDAAAAEAAEAAGTDSMANQSAPAEAAGVGSADVEATDAEATMGVSAVAACVQAVNTEATYEAGGAETFTAEAPGAEAGGAETVTAEARGVEAGGADTVTAEAPGAEAAGAETVTAEARGVEAGGAETVTAEAPGAEAAGAETVTAEAPVAEAGGAETVTAEAAGAEAAGAEIGQAPTARIRGSALDLSTVLQYCELAGLDTSQAGCVVDILEGWQQGTAPRVQLVQGPPGTGKTTMLVHLLSCLSAAKARTITAAPANAAVCVLATRFHSLVSSKQRQFAHMMASTSPTQTSTHPRDLVLIANSDVVDVTLPVVKQMDLEKKLDRLTAVLGPGPSGWTHNLQVLAALAANTEEVVARKADVIRRVQHMEGLAQQSQGPSARVLSERDEEALLKDFQRQPHTSAVLKQAAQLVFQDWVRGLQAIHEGCEVLELDLPSGCLPTEVFVRLAITAGEAGEKQGMMQKLQPQSLLQFTTDPDLRKAKHAKDDFQMRLHLMDLGEWLDGVKGLLPATLLNQCNLKDIKDIQTVMRDLVLLNARHIFCTVSGTGSEAMTQHAGLMDFAIIDEAAQLVEAETLILLNTFRNLESLLLVGDPKQLPATVISQAAVAKGYSRSMFERMQAAGHSVRMLEVQYRMKPAISRFPSDQFYQGRIRDGPNTTCPGYDHGIFEGRVYCFYNVKGSENTGPQGISYDNLTEARFVKDLMTRLIQMWTARRSLEPVTKLSVGVIAPYMAQVKLLQSTLDAAAYEEQGIQLKVSTVDSFQGSEQDVIIYSATRCNPRNSVGFLSDVRRLNVSITRSRWALWVVGHADTLCADPAWAAMIRHMQAQQAYEDVQGTVTCSVWGEGTSVTGGMRFARSVLPRVKQ